jgi:ribosomal-protein-alanine N-acetyltransferase
MSREEIKIREFKLSDLSQIVKLERECFKDPYNRFVFLILYKIFPKGFLVAEIDGKIVGYISLIKFRSKASLVSVAVSKSFRRRGIGERLVREVIERVKGKVKAVELEVRISNKEAISLYEKIGFVTIKRIKHYYLDGEDALKMRLMLKI